MKDYVLRDDETILFRGSAVLMPDGKKNAKNEEKSDVLLTNLNIVFVVKAKKLFRTIQEVNVYSVSDVKIYDEAVQIIRRKAVVDIYLKSIELFADFGKEKYAKEFCDKALKLISGNSKFVRSVKKTQKAIKETNEALDIDVVDMAKSGAAFACEVAVGVSTLNGASNKAKVAGKIADIVLSKKRKEIQMLPEGEEKDEPVDL